MNIVLLHLLEFSSLAYITLEQGETLPQCNYSGEVASKKLRTIPGSPKSFHPNKSPRLRTSGGISCWGVLARKNFKNGWTVWARRSEVWG